MIPIPSGLPIPIYNILVTILLAIFVFVSIGVPIALFVWLVRHSGKSVTSEKGNERSGGIGSALQIAHERYAKGEINRDEYQQIMDDLHKQKM